MFNFDANAGHGLLPDVLAYLRSCDYNFLNPSSVHRGGQKARAKIEEARESIRELTNANGYRVVFTSGATEANNTALSQAKYASKMHSNKIVTSYIEHPSILEYLAYLNSHSQAQDIKYYDFQQISNLDFNLNSNDFVSFMWANNETGQIIDLQTIANKIKANYQNVLFHSDAVQALGKLDMDLSSGTIDYISLSGHKIGGLSGVGALLIKEGASYQPLLLGGPQEVHHRAGTENVIGIISFGIAAKNWLKNGKAYRIELAQKREYIVNYLNQHLELLNFWSTSQGLVNTINLQIEGVRADDLVVGMDLQNYNISSGAACASGKPEPSHVLLAMGISEKAAKESVRISLEVGTDDHTINKFCETLVSLIRKFRKNGS